MSNPNTMAVNMSIKLATRKLTMSPNDFMLLDVEVLAMYPTMYGGIQTLEDWHRLVLDWKPAKLAKTTGNRKLL